ncbi:hypothetical protein HPQ64_01745 [Rhizobiales bacterium]|uniref:hypothetical protein n=1 Tax=Hongsoonwoonella zoysiae TaxID=2821844 RepID=UPI0015618050|nr:hypothetical protein [Hongsoonwoonella zoysiae]NRG16408.1 hypothetical protein [Hongsoonwoonella zoysiae]
MKKVALGVSLVLGAFCASGAQAADLLSSDYCPVAENAKLLAIQSDVELTSEVVRLMDEAVAVSDSPQWIYSGRPAFVWASEAKVACGKAFGYLRANYRDEDNLNKCECFHSRMLQYMN